MLCSEVFLSRIYTTHLRILGVIQWPAIHTFGSALVLSIIEYIEHVSMTDDAFVWAIIFWLSYFYYNKKKLRERNWKTRYRIGCKRMEMSQANIPYQCTKKLIYLRFWGLPPRLFMKTSSCTAVMFSYLFLINTHVVTYKRRRTTRHSRS